MSVYWWKDGLIYLFNSLINIKYLWVLGWDFKEVGLFFYWEVVEVEWLVVLILELGCMSLYFGYSSY